MIHRFPVFAVLATSVEDGSTVVMGASPEAEVASEISSQIKGMFKAVMAVPGLSDDDMDKALVAYKSVRTFQGILVVNETRGVLEPEDVMVIATPEEQATFMAELRAEADASVAG